MLILEEVELLTVFEFCISTSVSILTSLVYRYTCVVHVLNKCSIAFNIVFVVVYSYRSVVSLQYRGSCIYNIV